MTNGKKQENGEIYSRTAALIGEDGLRKLMRARVLLVGVGGVGGYTCEALARAGVGHLTLVDPDLVSPSNINRQIFALRSTVGMAKVEAARRRILDINPDIDVCCRREMLMPDNADGFDFSSYDAIADCVDTVSAKVEIACRGERAGVPVVSAMGAGNKLDASAFRVTDIGKTSVCPLARVMRYELRRRGVRHLRVVYSEEPPVRGKNAAAVDTDSGKPIPASIAPVPGAAGLVLAGEILRILLERETPETVG